MLALGTLSSCCMPLMERQYCMPLAPQGCCLRAVSMGLQYIAQLAVVPLLFPHTLCLALLTARKGAPLLRAKPFFVDSHMLCPRIEDRQRLILYRGDHTVTV